MVGLVRVGPMAGIAAASAGLAAGGAAAGGAVAGEAMGFVPDRVTLWESEVCQGGPSAAAALAALMQLKKKPGLSQRLFDFLRQLPTAWLMQNIHNALPDDPAVADRNVRFLGALAAAGSFTAQDAVVALSRHPDPLYYIRGVEQLVTLAIQNHILPPEVTQILDNSGPRLIPFLHAWAVRSPGTLRLNPDALVQVASREGMVSADMIYVVGVFARTASAPAQLLIRRLLPLAGPERSALQQIAMDHSTVGKILSHDRRRPHRTTQIDLMRGRDAEFAKLALANPQIVTTPKQVQQLATGAHHGVPLALESLHGIAQGGGPHRQLAGDLLGLLARDPTYLHHGTAQLMLRDPQKNDIL